MRLIAGHIRAPYKLLAAFNGEASSAGQGSYAIGLATSNDFATWQTLSGAQISAGSGWEATWVGQPWLVWDGSQYVIFYSGWNSTNMAIGRATASNFYGGSWTKYASNPVVPHGSSGDPDEIGAGMPVVHYDPLDSPAWRMWYHGFPSGSSPTNPTGLTVCHADSSDGITWTKRGTVIPVGSASSFTDIGSDVGCVIKSGSTWYVFMAGYHSYSGRTLSKSGYCTTTNPASSGSYSALSQLTNYTGNVDSNGFTWQSNQPRGIMAYGSGYLCWLTLWAPTVTGNTLEAAVQVYSPDLTSWTAPTQVMLPYESWDSISAENPSVVVAP